MHTLALSTKARNTMVNITESLREAVKTMAFEDGLLTVYCPHTTAGVTINESDDPNVQTDILKRLNDLVPLNLEYAHYENNADAHIKASLIGSSCTVFVEKGELQLGQWQAVYFCEFDGPRDRQLWLKTKG